MKNGYQSVCEKVGKYGCYALCLIHLAEKIGFNTKDPVSLVWAGIKNGYISDKDCTVLNAAGFFSVITAQNWTLVKYNGTHRLPPNFPTEPNDLKVNEWYNERTGLTHFTCDDYDGLDGSVTVKEGKIRSLRVLRRKI